LPTAPFGAEVAAKTLAKSSPAPRRRPGPPRLRLPAFHPVVVPAILPTDPSFAAADVRRPAPGVTAPARGNRFLVPASLALLALVAASGSFLLLAGRLRRGLTPRAS
jgi:hypothetical protein